MTGGQKENSAGGARRGPLASPTRGVVGRLALIGILLLAVPALLWIGAGRSHPAPPRAPGVTPIHGIVTKQVLTATYVGRASVSGGSVITPACLPGATGPAGNVVTRPPSPPGTAVNIGDRILEVNGRPVFAIKGSSPLYRDLHPGMSGPDVAELQTSLLELGLHTSDHLGQFGASTARAVSAWYAKEGYSPPPIPQGDLDRLSSVQMMVLAAKQTLVQAQSALAAAAAPPAPSILAQAVQAVASAQAAVAANGTSTADPTAETQLEMAQHTLAILQAPRPVGQETQAAAAGATGVRTAQADQDATIQTTGEWVPLCEVLLIPSFPAHTVTPPGSGGQSPAVAAGGSPAASKAPAAPVAVISAGSLVAQADMPPAVTNELHVGQTAELQPAGETRPIEAVIASVSTLTDPNAASPNDHVVELSLPADVGSSLADQDVQISLSVGTTKSPVLAVPAGAVTISPNGGSQLTVVRPGKRPVLIPVRTGLLASGLIEVENPRLVAGESVSLDGA